MVKYVNNPFTDDATFDWDKFKESIRIANRFADNVVEINGLPLQSQRDEIKRKRRHGLGFLGLGSTLTMLKMKYSDSKAVEFTEEVTKTIAIDSYREGVALAKEKGSAPIMEEIFTVTPEMFNLNPENLSKAGIAIGMKVKGKTLFATSRYFNNFPEDLVDDLRKYGCRYSHATSIAPTGSMALGVGNNQSNGIEPSFSHFYKRNIIIPGKKTKEQVPVYSYEFLAYKTAIQNGYITNPVLTKESSDEEILNNLPEYFSTSDTILPKNHVDIQAAAQRWIDSAISKTINVPTDCPFEEFKEIYMYAYEKGLKGCTTFRFNPEAFSGVLVKEDDLAATKYVFTTKDGQEYVVNGNDIVVYDGEEHVAANLFDALKEGLYGKF